MYHCFMQHDSINAAGLTCDTGQARGPIRDTGQGRSDVSQDAVDVILHPD